MITTKRSGNVRIESYSKSNGQVGLLERPVSNYKEYTNTAPAQEEDLETARARMQANLDRLLNYNKQIDEPIGAEQENIVMDATETVEDAQVEVASATINADEDIKPTSTTMQFGDGDLDQMYKEMNVKTEEKHSYRLNAKGKLAVVLYSLAVAIILALIIFNTGLLANLKSVNEVKTAELNQYMADVASQDQVIYELSNNEHVINVAKNEYGMIK